MLPLRLATHRRGFLRLAGAATAFTALAQLRALPPAAQASPAEAGPFDAMETEILTQIVERMVETGEPAAPRVRSTAAIPTIAALCQRLDPGVVGQLSMALRLFEYVSPGYFHAIGTRIVAGRDYSWTDVRERRRFAIVSENLAREIWGSAQAALGRRLQTLPGAPWREVVGVVQDVRQNGVQEAAPAIVYWPSAGESLYRPEPTATRTLTFVVRSPRTGADAFVREIQQAIWSVNGSVAIASVRTLQEIYNQSLARTSFTLVMLALAGGMALLLGVVGIYGLISYGVSRRRREIGIRLAMGAQRPEVSRMFLRWAAALVSLGVPVGLATAAGLTRLMSSLLYGVTPLDAPTYVVTPLVVVAAALLASWIPARRAAGVDPMEALRVE